MFVLDCGGNEKGKKGDGYELGKDLEMTKDLKVKEDIEPGQMKKFAKKSKKLMLDEIEEEDNEISMNSPDAKIIQRNKLQKNLKEIFEELEEKKEEEESLDFGNLDGYG